MDHIIKHSSKHSNKFLLCIIFILGALLLLGAASVHSNISRSDAKKDVEKEKILEILGQLSCDLPEKNRSSWTEKNAADPYFYLAVNSCGLK